MAELGLSVDRLPLYSGYSIEHPLCGKDVYAYIQHHNGLIFTLQTSVDMAALIPTIVTTTKQMDLILI